MKLLKKPSGIWWVDFKDEDGRRRRVSTGCKDKADATRRAREIVLGIDRPVAPSDTPPEPGTVKAQGLTMAELFDLCCKGKGPWTTSKVRSQATVKSNIKILSTYLGREEVKSITKQRLELLVDQLTEAGYAPGTIKRKLDSVSAALSFALETNLIASRPKMPRMTFNNIQERILEDDEEELVFQAIDARIASEPQRPWTRFRHLIRFLLDTGCRLGEPLQATANWFVFHGEGDPVIEIPAWATKTQKARAVPLTPAIVETLPYLRITSEPGTGRIFPFRPATAWYMWNTIRADVRALGGDIDEVNIHTLRHTCITRLLRGGMALHLVSKWAGHANIQITIERYGKVGTVDLKEGAAILAAPRKKRGIHLKVVSA